MFCVECGKEGEVHEGLCRECYLSKRQFVHLPKKLDVHICGECFAVRIGKSWIDALDIDRAISRSLEEAVEKEDKVHDIDMTVNLTERDPRNYLAVVDLDFGIDTLRASKRFNLDIRLKKDTCQRCGRRAGHYYEAIIQLRQSDKRSSQSGKLERARRDLLDSIEKTSSKNREVYISKEEKKHGGYDFYISSSSAAKSIAREIAKTYSATAKSSVSIAGRKDGHDFVRTTHIVRFPAYEIGDVLAIGGHHYLLRHIDGSRLGLIDLESWKEITLKPDRRTKIDVLERELCVKDATVVSEGQEDIQILDPDTMMVVELRKPHGIHMSGTTVKTVKTKNRIFILP